MENKIHRFHSLNQKKDLSVQPAERKKNSIFKNKAKNWLRKGYTAVVAGFMALSLLPAAVYAEEPISDPVDYEVIENINGLESAVEKGGKYKVTKSFGVNDALVVKNDTTIHVASDVKLSLTGKANSMFTMDSSGKTLILEGEGTLKGRENAKKALINITNGNLTVQDSIVIEDHHNTAPTNC